jgi:hypothetical protein
MQARFIGLLYHNSTLFRKLLGIEKNPAAGE